MSGGVVSYVSRHFAGQPIVYLDPDPRGPQKAVIFVVDGAQYKLSLGEAAQLADRLRRISGGSLESPSTTVAVRIEQLLEEAIDEIRPMDFLDSEKTAIRWAISEWLNEVGVPELPKRVTNLRDALRDEAQDSPPG